MSELGFKNLHAAELARREAAEAQRDAAIAEKNAAITRLKANENQIAELIGRMTTIPHHIREDIRGLDPGDSLAHILGRSGDWTSPAFEKAAPKSHEEKAARAVNPRRYLVG